MTSASAASPLWVAGGPCCRLIPAPTVPQSAKHPYKSYNVLSV